MTNIRTLTTSELQNFLARTAIGADRYLEEIFTTKSSNYPPYDIEALGEDDYRVTIAVAGFSRKEIEVSINNGNLIVSGNIAETAEIDGEEKKFPVMIHKGIAKRDFTRTFKLMEYVVVNEVTLKDGLLTINLKRELPEALKPRVIEIK